MQFKLKSKNFLVLALCAVVFVLGLSVSIQMRKTPTGLTFDTHLSVPFVHATDEQGCVTCHSQPITGSCVGCHPSPPASFDNGVIFPHHDREEGGPLDTCSDSSCHDAEDDIRFIDTPKASHSYCDNCHELAMSHS